MSSLPEPLLARPFAYEEVRDRTPTEWQPAFELSSRVTVPESMIEPARAEAQAAGYAAGWAQGVSDARASMLADVEQARVRAAEIEQQRVAAVTRGLTALDRAVSEFESRAVPTVERIEDTVVEMAVAIAEAVLGHELRRRNDRMIITALARILELAPANEAVTVRLSPEDHEVLNASDAMASLGSARRIELVVAPELSPGDAIAVCGATEIDGRIQPALERIRDVLASDDVRERRAAR